MDYMKIINKGSTYVLIAIILYVFFFIISSDVSVGEKGAILGKTIFIFLLVLFGVTLGKYAYNKRMGGNKQ